jgi:hypothetical protein
MSECSVCKKSTGQVRHKISCNECKRLCHSTCVNLTKEDIDFIIAEKQTWRCPPCSRERRGSMSGSSMIESLPGTSLEQILSKLDEAANERRRIEAEINKAFEFVHEKIDEQKAAITKQSETLAQYLTFFEDLRNENQSLKKKIIDLETRIEENEQYLRSNSLEIQGVPEDKNEDVYEVVKRVAASLDLSIQREAIDICHRLGKRSGNDKPAGIIVKFVRREDKIKMLEKRRVKRNLSTSDIGFSGPSVPVYVNESLSPAKRKLLGAARAAKREKGYTYLWIRSGKIFLRKNQGDPVIIVNSMQQVEQLK